jgi:hypothetical protein
MPKLNILVRNLILSPGMSARLESKVSNEAKGRVPPGTLLKRGDWYFLTYLKIVKIQNFDATAVELLDTEVNTTSVALFRITPSGTLIVNGTIRALKEIEMYLEALALEEAGVKPDVPEFNLNQHYQVNEIVIDPDVILSKFEKYEAVTGISKMKFSQIEVSMGTINKCVVVVQDYITAKKLLSKNNDDKKIIGMQLDLREPAKTNIYYGVDGQINIQSKTTDVELNDLMDLALKMLN